MIRRAAAGTRDQAARFLDELARVERWKPLVRPGRSLAQIALAWALVTPGVTCAIPGATSAGEMQSNATAADLTLTDDEIALLNTGETSPTGKFDMSG